MGMGGGVRYGMGRRDDATRRGQCRANRRANEQSRGRNEMKKALTVCARPHQNRSRARIESGTENGRGQRQ